MTAFWSFQSNRFSRSFGHVPNAWESVVSFSEDVCWNCSGELLVERFYNKGFLERKICPVCDGIGMILTSDRSYPLDPEWAKNPDYWRFILINNQENLFEIPNL